MGVPIVRSCCICVNLHTATIVIGCLYTVWSILELIGYTLLVTLRPIDSEGARVSYQKQVLYVIAAIVAGIHLLSSVLLVVAAIKRLPSLTLPWTIVTGILTSIFFILCLTGISLIIQDTGALLEVEAFIIFVHLARACISVYCIVVVHSRHKQLMAEDYEKRFQHSGRVYRPVTTDDTL